MPIVLFLIFAFGSLGDQIQRIAESAHGKVGVACSIPGRTLDCNLNSQAGLPMQSVYKFPIAIAVLHAIEIGKLTYTEELRFEKSDRIAADQGSRLQKEHPQGGVNVPVSELLRLMVCESDGVASDLLLRASGGPAAVSAYIQSLGVSGIHIRDSEQTLGRNEQLQYRNDATAEEMVELLRLVADHSPLSAEHTRLLLNLMEQTKTGENRIRALLPKDTVIAHRTGTAGSHSQKTNVTNDVALITLQNGQKLALAILVCDSTLAQGDRERVIAKIARAVWNAAN